MHSDESAIEQSRPDIIDRSAYLRGLNYVHVATDGSLAFAGLNQRMLRSYRWTPMAALRALRWRARIAARVRHARSHRIPLAVMIVPERASVHAEAIAGIRISYERSPASQVMAFLVRGSTGECVVDLLSVFRDHRERIPLYLSTDSHWTHGGAYLAYRHLCERFAATPACRLANGRIVGEQQFSGDLGIAVSPERTETILVRDLTKHAKRIKANRLVRDAEDRREPLTLGAGAYVAYRNDATEADPRCLLIFGDSYCHHSDTIRSGNLTRLLAETFREVHFVWTNGYDRDLVAWIRPDLILCEVAERYLDKIPARRFRTPD